MANDSDQALNVITELPERQTAAAYRSMMEFLYPEVPELV